MVNIQAEKRCVGSRLQVSAALERKTAQQGARARVLCVCAICVSCACVCLVPCQIPSKKDRTRGCAHSCLALDVCMCYMFFVCVCMPCPLSKLQVSFAKETYIRHDILQMRPMTCVCATCFSCACVRLVPCQIPSTTHEVRE